MPKKNWRCRVARVPFDKTTTAIPQWRSGRRPVIFNQIGWTSAVGQSTTKQKTKPTVIYLQMCNTYIGLIAVPCTHVI